MFETGLADAFRNNVTGFLRVLEQARLRGIKQLVYASTSLVYGNVDPPLRESGPTDDLNFYALSKHTMENIARLFYAERGMTSVGLRFMSVYGPRENHKGRMANLVSQFIWDIEAGRAPVIYGSGTQTRDFTSVWDVAAAIERFLARPGDGGARVFNVGAGVATSLNELVERLSAVMGVPVAPVYVPIPVGRAYNRSQVASIDAIRRENGWKPAVSLEAGVREILRLRGWPAGGHPAERAVA
jgi:UDP-glucose 4-epimerase